MSHVAHMNHTSRRHLAVRPLAQSFLPLLRRAIGLDLVDLKDSRVANTLALPDHDVGHDDEVLRFELLPVSNKIVPVVERTVGVVYPAPGWSGNSRKLWDLENVCFKRCSFPQACAC